MSEKGLFSNLMIMKYSTEYHWGTTGYHPLSISVHCHFLLLSSSIHLSESEWICASTSALASFATVSPPLMQIVSGMHICAVSHWALLPPWSIKHHVWPQQLGANYFFKYLTTAATCLFQPEMSSYWSCLSLRTRGITYSCNWTVTVF